MIEQTMNLFFTLFRENAAKINSENWVKSRNLEGTLKKDSGGMVNRICVGDDSPKEINNEIMASVPNIETSFVVLLLFFRKANIKLAAARKMGIIPRYAWDSQKIPHLPGIQCGYVLFFGEPR